MSTGLEISTSTNTSPQRRRDDASVAKDERGNATVQSFLLAFAQFSQPAAAEVQILSTVDDSPRRERIDGELTQQSTTRNERGGRAQGLTDLDGQSRSPSQSTADLKKIDQSTDRQSNPSDHGQSRVRTHDASIAMTGGQTHVSDSNTEVSDVNQPKVRPSDSADALGLDQERSNPQKSPPSSMNEQYRGNSAQTVDAAAARSATIDSNPPPSSGKSSVGKIQATSPLAGDKTPSETAPPKDQIKQQRPSVPEKRPASGSDRQSTAKEVSREGFEKLLRTMRMSLRPGRSSATLRLEPPDLGRVRIQVNMNSNRMTLQIETETRDAGAALASRIPDLAASLKENGVNLVDYEFSQPSPEQWEQQSRREHAESPSAGGMAVAESGALSQSVEDELSPMSAEERDSTTYSVGARVSGGIDLRA